MKFINLKTFTLFFLTVVICTGVSVRYSQIDSHFSHVDDLIPANTYEALTYSKIKEKTNLSFSEKNEELFKNLFYIAKKIIYPAAISSTSTYAPLQFLFTGFLLDNNHSYKEILYWSRLPSFIFSILSFFVLIFFFKTISNNNYLELSLVGLSMLAFSWKFIIYSVQSESYAVGVFSALSVLLLIANYLKKIEKIKTRRTIFYGLVFGFLMCFNYQIIFFLPSVLLTIFFFYRFKFKSTPHYYYIFTSIVLLFFLLLYFIFLRNLVSRGVGWNAGPDNEFLFSINGLSAVESIFYFFKFFLLNSYHTIQSIIGIVELDHIFSDFYTLIIIIFSLIGLFTFLSSKNYIFKFIGIFTLITAITWTILIVLQKITLSPTRHSLILLSFFAAHVPIGILTFSKLIKKNNILKRYIFQIFSISVFVLFLLSFENIREKRVDKFEEKEITELAKKYDVNYIITRGFTSNLSLMKYIRDNFIIIHSSYLNEKHYVKNKFIKVPLSTGDIVYIKKNPKQSKVNYLFISHRNNHLTEKFINSYILNRSFKLFYKKEIASKTQIEFSNKTQSGTNSIYMYIYKQSKK